MKYLLTMLFGFGSFILIAQDTIKVEYLDADKKLTNKEKKAVYLQQEFWQRDTSTIHIREIKSEALILQKQYIQSNGTQLPHGKWFELEDGDTVISTFYNVGEPIGIWKIRNREINYNFNLKYLTPEEKSKRNTLPADFDTTNKTIYRVIDGQPEFPGGLQKLYEFLGSALHYSMAAREARIQGIVYVEFIIDADGNVEDPIVVKGINPLIDKEALRVIRALPVWKPGMQKGKPVPVYFTMPVRFQLL